MYEIIYYCQLVPGSPSLPLPEEKRRRNRCRYGGRAFAAATFLLWSHNNGFCRVNENNQKRNGFPSSGIVLTLPLSGCFIVFGYVSMSSIFRYCGGDGKGGRNRPTNRICCLVDGETLSRTKAEKTGHAG